VVSAQFQLPDGRVLVMTVLADRLTVHLPVDSPRGIGTISAFVRDAAGNTATRTREVVLDGVIPVEPVTRPGGFPLAPPRRTPTAEIRRTRTRAATRSQYRVEVEGAPRILARAETASRYRVDVRVAHLTAAEARGRLLIMSSAAHNRDEATLATSYAVSKRAEGPEAEAELLLLL